MKKTKYLWIVHVLFVVYIVVLFKFTIFRAKIVPRELNWHFFREYLRFLQNHSWGHFIYFFVGNIAAFIPLGMYLSYLGKRPVSTVIAGFLLSLFIETMQYVWSVGVSELDDLILNTIGAFVGVWVVRILQKKFAKKSGQTT